MAVKAIRDNDIAFGRAVLLATDSLGMSAEGAFWVYDDSEPTWRFVLVTSVFGLMGPHETFLRLNRALQEKLSENELREFEFLVADPKEAIIGPVRKAIETTPYASEPRRVQVNFGQGPMEAIVYRMAASLSVEDAKSARRKFKKISNAFAVA